MSSTCTSGRQGEPSLSSRTWPVVIATAVRLLTTMSMRCRGEAPYAVALRRYVGLKCVVGQKCKLALGHDLRFTVRSHGEQLGVFGDGS